MTITDQHTWCHTQKYRIYIYFYILRFGNPQEMCILLELCSTNLGAYKLEDGLLRDPICSLQGTRSTIWAFDGFRFDTVLLGDVPSHIELLRLLFQLLIGRNWAGWDGQRLLNGGVTKMFESYTLDVAHRTVVGVCWAVASRTADVLRAHVTSWTEAARGGARGDWVSPDMALVPCRSLPALHF